nr:unnamed protein product [uncultured bacterium]
MSVQQFDYTMDVRTLYNEGLYPSPCLYINTVGCSLSRKICKGDKELEKVIAQNGNFVVETVPRVVGTYIYSSADNCTKLNMFCAIPLRNTLD